MTTQRSALHPGPTPQDLDRIPKALKQLPQWVLWRGADRLDQQTGEVKLNKIPIDPQTLSNADTTDPTTWGTFDQCVAALPLALEEWAYDGPGAYRGGGIGYVFSDEDPYSGVDLDHCRDPDTGAIADGAQAHIDALASYTEVTPSGTGVHILVQGTLPPRGRRKGAVEMYDYARFFTMTGWHLAGTPTTIKTRQKALSAFHSAIFGAPRSTHQHGPAPQAAGTPLLEDAVLLDKARAAQNGTRFTALWSGDITGYDSPSNADLALCVRLAFWTQDAAQIDRLFRQSGLVRDKWDEKRGAQTYGERTIAEALARRTEHYRAPGEAQRRRNGQAPGPEPDDPSACPELPAYAQTDEDAAARASIFLDDYIAFSQKWAPRAYAGFHEAAALFALSTTAARRIKIQLGPRGVFTSLYLALASRTSLYTKTTAADLALTLLRRAELTGLLADDDATPQAFLRSLTLHVPPDYADLEEDAQQDLRQRLAFAGQKGWFYEEWGQHLHAMMQKEGMMAAFRSILRRLDDHQDQYVYSSISRGRDILIKPYVTLLANVTPADLKPFLRMQSPLWRDGYIARFAFIAPGEAPTTLAPFPEGTFTITKALVTTLAAWHKRLGIPRVTVEPIRGPKGKDTGRHRIVFTQVHKETTYTLSPEVRTAFYAYDQAMHELMAYTNNEDLDGSYARFPMKALRIAGLLASLHDDASKYTIWPAQWYRGQAIAERWRRDLHKLMHQVDEGEAPSREARYEQRILDVLKRHGALSIREINRWTKLAHSDIAAALPVLQTAGVVEESATARTTKYRYRLAEESEGAKPQSAENAERENRRK
jgi:hypothetical protein